MLDPLDDQADTEARLEPLDSGVRNRWRPWMLFGRTSVWALTGAMMIASPVDVGAESPSEASAPPERASPSDPSQPEPAGRTLTAKERLGNKASDEQRVDNCNVPPELRGPKPRPDSCDRDERGRP
jgi:hypothetical protein